MGWGKGGILEAVTRTVVGTAVVLHLWSLIRTGSSNYTQELIMDDGCYLRNHLSVSFIYLTDLLIPVF